MMALQQVLLGAPCRPFPVAMARNASLSTCRGVAGDTKCDHNPVKHEFRFKHEGVVAGVAQEGFPTSNCYRCSGGVFLFFLLQYATVLLISKIGSSVGHFARDCPTFTGIRRDAMVINSLYRI